MRQLSSAAPAGADGSASIAADRTWQGMLMADVPQAGRAMSPPGAKSVSS